MLCCAIFLDSAMCTGEEMMSAILSKATSPLDSNNPWDAFQFRSFKTDSSTRSIPNSPASTAAITSSIAVVTSGLISMRSAPAFSAATTAFPGEK